MGIDKNRFRGQVPEEAMCAICLDVLEDPVQRDSCQHIFCKSCISQWLLTRQECPECRQPLDESDLKPVPRVLTSLLQKVELSCNFASEGCKESICVDQLSSHALTCHYNPDLVIDCECGERLQKVNNTFPSHSCHSYCSTVVNIMEKQAEASLNTMSELIKRSSTVNIENKLMQHLFDDGDQVFKDEEELKSEFKKYKKLVGNNPRPLTGAIEIAIKTLGEDEKTRLPKILKKLKKNL